MQYEALKKGDLVERIKNNSSFIKGAPYKVEKDCLETDNESTSLYIEGMGAWDRGNFRKITTKTSIMTNLTKKFRLLTKSEPEKTFIEQGVMDDNENLTTEGRALFEAFLVNKFGTEFKTEVVDKLVDDEKK